MVRFKKKNETILTTFLILIFFVNVFGLLAVEFVSSVKAKPDWLTGWQYRKSHVINAASGAGTGYQVRIVAHYGSGTDSGADVYLNSHSRTDFGDVRFTDDDGTTLLDYWMESKVDSNYAVFWVEVADNLSAANVTIYIYYGKTDATTTSNFVNTFLRIIDGAVPTKLALPFDEGSGTTAYDKSGNNNNGTIYGASWVDGKYGKALSFDGVDNYVRVPQSESLNSFADTDELSVGFWLNLKERPSNWSALISMPGSADMGFNLHVASTAFYLWLGLDGTRTLILAFEYPDTWLNTWKHHFVTVKTGVSRWYVNGGLLNSASHSANLTVNTGDLFINSGAAYWKGIIDEVRIYNQALSAEEISDIYNNYLFEVPSNSESVGKGIVRKYVSPEPAHGSWGSEFEGPPEPLLPTINPWNFLQYFFSGNWLGFIQAVWISAFASTDIFYIMITLAISLTVYIRVKSLLFLAIIWILVGTFLISMMQTASGMAVFLLGMAAAALIFKLFTYLRPQQGS